MLSFILLIIISITAVLLITVCSKSNFNPARLLVIYWLANIFICRILLDYDWNNMGLIWIIFACICFFISFTVICERIEYTRPLKVYIKINHKISNIILICCIGLSLIYVGLQFKKYGFSPSMIFNLDSLFDMNKQTAYLRYYTSGNSSLFMQFFLTFVYASPLLGGYSFIYAESRLSKILSIFSLLPAFCVLLITNAKAILIASCIFWGSSWIVAQIERNKKIPKINHKKLFRFAVILVFLISVLFFSMMLRIGSSDMATFNIVKNKMMSYAFGHMAAFDYWFGDFPNNITHTLGSYTFSGIFSFFGIVDRAQGVYTDFFRNESLGTNVYTVFRGIITDFGIFGGLLFFAFTGAVSGSAYKKVMTCKTIRALSDTVLVFIFSFIFYSFIVSTLSYVSFIIAYLIFFFYLLCIKNQNT